MKQTTRWRSFSCWAACLVALASAPTWAQAQVGGQVYIQGSEVNLRDKAATHAKVVAKVTIGTGCQQVKSAPKQWVRLKCGDAEGFTLKSLVGTEKPTIEALLVQAQDTKQPAKVRLDAALRAATLDSENAQALKLVSDLFFDVSFEQLLKDRDLRRRKGGFHELFKVRREVKSTYPKTTRESGEEALLRELEKVEFDWHRFEARGHDFISAMYRGGELVVYAGGFGSKNGSDELNDTDEDFLVAIDSRSNSGGAETLKRALQQGARTPTPDARPASGAHGESADQPALSLEALRLYQSLPGRWYELSTTEAGERFLRTSCGLLGAELLVDIHRRASIWWRTFSAPEEPMTGVWQVLSISKIATGAQFQMRDPEGHPRRLTITWPTAEANVSRWDREPYKYSEYYLVANVKNSFRIDDSPCDVIE